MQALPIRIRLSIWYFAMFATAACLLSAASWWMLSSSLDSTEYYELQERAEDVRDLLAHEPANSTVEGLQRALSSIYVLKDDGKWLQVMDQDGNWIFRSKRMTAENPYMPRPERLPSHGTISGFLQDKHHVLMLAYPITVNGKGYSVQTGLSLNRSMVLLHNFGAGLLLLTPAVILLAALGGYWMSRKALRPVALLAAEARKIHDRNLDTRLPVPTANDEISLLSRTLNQMLERIDKAFGSVRAFTGNASHELRTPIALLRTEIEVALYKPRTTEEYRETLSSLHQEAVRMSYLVENLLALARADGGAEAFSLIPVDVQPLLQRIDKTWRKAMRMAMVDFRVEAGEQDVAMLGDTASIARLLSILLENASKFTPPGGSVVVTAVASGKQVLLSVRDTGIGIPEADLPLIFDRFYRSSSSGGLTSRGSGLGLALGKWIAERHGTKLTVESVTGRGSCFSFALDRVTSVTSVRSNKTTFAK